LQGYMRYFIAQKLKNSLLHLCEDIAQESNLAIIQSEKLFAQLGTYLKSNTVPGGKDLSLLKAILFRQRLKFIEKETRYTVVSLDSFKNLSREDTL
jgi:hypothetical protein